MGLMLVFLNPDAMSIYITVLGSCIFVRIFRLGLLTQGDNLQYDDVTDAVKYGNL